MIKCASIYTYEIDNRSAALDEIKKQLSEKITLLKNTVGVIMCHPEFISSGVLRYISINLPFSTMGVTTAAQAVNGEAGELILTIFVMTSDDVWFRTGVAENIQEDLDKSVAAGYENASRGETEAPRLALIFPPIFLKYAGDDYIDAWQKCIPGTPLFGTLAMDDTPTFEDSETIYNGQSSKTAIPFILCYGDINPRFLIGSIPEEKGMPYTGEITSSTGSRVHEINGMSTYRYFESIGFESNGVSSVNYLFIPFSISNKTGAGDDGIPVIRILSSYAEDGTAIFHGNVAQGSIFTLLQCESDDVISSAKEMIDRLNVMQDVNGVLLFSCIVRRILTMGDTHDEMNFEFESVKNALNPDIPFLMGCAGGEVCPTVIKEGIPTNRYHEYSLVILVV